MKKKNNVQILLKKIIRYVNERGRKKKNYLSKAFNYQDKDHININGIK